MRVALMHPILGLKQLSDCNGLLSRHSFCSYGATRIPSASSQIQAASTISPQQSDFTFSEIEHYFTLGKEKADMGSTRKPQDKTHQHYLFTVINTVFSMAILSYVVSVEHRITALETRIQMQNQYQNERQNIDGKPQN